MSDKRERETRASTAPTQVNAQVESAAAVPDVRSGAPAPAFGRYTDALEIGKGGMGVILRATDPELRRPIAIKVLPGERFSGASMERFLREARLTGSLEHPNIVPVHDLSTTADGRRFFSMKLVKGESLAELLAPRREHAFLGLLTIFLKVLDGVAFAHSRGVVHRDIKPANIMVGEYGEVLVMDWGLARTRNSELQIADCKLQIEKPGVDAKLTQAGAVMGTPAYMPPEQAAGEIDRIDERSDIYSLGALLYQILARQAPYEGRSVDSILSQVKEGRLVPPSKRSGERVVPRELEAVVMRAMAARPEDRYPSVADLRGEVEAYLEGRTLVAARYWLGERALKWVRRNRLASAVGAAGIVALASLAAVLVPRWLTAERARVEALEDAVRDSKARERARDHLEVGRRILVQMLLAKRDKDDPHEAMAERARRAIAEFEEALAEHSRIPEAYLGIARAHVDTGNRDSAMRALELALELSPTFATARLDRVRLLLPEYEATRHEWDGRLRPETSEAKELRLEIEKDLEQVEEESQEQAERIYARGLLAFCDADYAGTARILEEYLGLAPADPEAHYWLAHAMFHIDPTSTEVDKALEAAIVRDVRMGDAYKLLAIARSSTSGPDARMEVLDRWIAADPGRVAAYSVRSDMLERYQRVEEASKDADRVLELAPGDPQSYLRRAHLRAELGQAEGARADYLRALELAPGDPDAGSALALLRLQAGDPDGARIEVERVIDDTPEHAYAHVVLGQILHELGDDEGALGQFHWAIELDPKLVEAYRLRAHLRNAADDPQGAINDLTKAIEIAPETAVLCLYERSHLLRESGKPREALADLDRFLQFGPSSALAHHGRATLLRELGENEKAAAAFERAIELEPTYIAAHRALGATLKKLGRLDDAASAYGRMIDAFPDSTEPYHQRAMAYWEAGKLDSALADIEAILRIDPRDTLGWIDKGTILEAKGDLELALASFDQGIALDPSATNPYELRALLRRRLGDSRGASEDFGRLAVLDPRRAARNQANRGACLLELAASLDASTKSDEAAHARREAIEAFSQSIGLASDDPAPYRHRARAREALGEIDLAISDFERLRELVPAEERDAIDVDLERLRRPR